MINREAPEWPYEQVAAILRARIKAGQLGPKLPSYMALAEELDVAPMTIQRALRVLKDEGLIYGKPGLGTFVAESS